jgi:hypothetical protein
VKWKDKVAPEVTPGYTNIPHNTDQASSRNQNTEYVLPHLFQFDKERFVFLYVSQLIRILIITL